MGLGEYWRSPLDPERVMHVDVTHWREREQEQREDALSVEEPFEVRIDHRSLAVVMRTPGNDSELAMGSLYREEGIAQPGEVLTIVADTDDDDFPLTNVVNVIFDKHGR